MDNPTSWTCFGRLWEKGQVECEGGFDLAYAAPHTRSKLRQRCSAYEDCKSKVMWNRQVVPTNSLVRPQVPALTAPPMIPVPPPVPLMYQKPPQYPVPYPQQQAPQPQQYYPQYQQQQYYQQQQQYPVAPPGQVPPWVAQYGPQNVPTPYQQPGAQMPAYLTVPEPHDGNPWWVRLANEILRSIAKAIGHSTASFFDHNPIRMHKAPQQPQPPQPPS